MENHYKVHGKGKTIGTYFWKSNKKIKIEYSLRHYERKEWLSQLSDFFRYRKSFDNSGVARHANWQSTDQASAGLGFRVARTL